MSDSTTSNTSSTNASDPGSSTSEPSESEGLSSSDLKHREREHATEALYRKLKTLLHKRFPEWLQSQEFVIQRKDSDAADWTFRFEPQESMSRTRHDDVKIAVCIDHRGQTFEYDTHLALNREDGLGFRVRGEGQGQWKTFDLGTLGEPIDAGWRLEDDSRTLTYNNRRFSQNVLRVWFSKSEEASSGALKFPVQLRHRLEDGSLAPISWDTWARFASGGVEVELPDTNVGVSVDDFPVETSEEEWMPVWLSHLAYWLVCNVYAPKGTLRTKEGDPPNGFPDVDQYKARRAVNLNPATVIDRLAEDHLYFPWHVVESACSALNAGKHVIFTGPPGCGKSKLSIFLAQEATGEPPLMSTASPAWTSGDLLGRYMPDRSGQGLVFQEGFFLRALGQGTQGKNQRSRWLIVDEFNRADIDACFGELFSVLAGDTVELPFQREVEDEENGTTSAEVRIIPSDEDAETDADYLVPAEFRMIGTMNDADRSGLNSLSYALMRRFAIIPVEAPANDAVTRIINDSIQTTEEDLDLDRYGWDVSERGTEKCSLELINKELQALFAHLGTDDSFENLVSERVVGVSVIGDVIRFVGEGLRAETASESIRRSENLKSEWRDGVEERAKTLTLSYLALAVVLQVYPQLEALATGTSRGDNQLRLAIEHIFSALSPERRMVRVAKSEDGYELQSDMTIGEFLYRNLQTRFSHQAPAWKEDLLS